MMLEKYQKRGRNRRSLPNQPTFDQVSKTIALVLEGVSVSEITKATGLKPYLVNEIIEKEGLPKPRDIRRVLRHRAHKECVNGDALPIETNSEHYVRDKYILELAETGMTLDRIGMEVGLTRERVRQILKDEWQVDTRGIRGQLKERISEEKHVTSNFLTEWVRTHPGCTLEEVAHACQIDARQARDLLSTEVRHLVILATDETLESTSPGRNEEQIVESLRHAAQLTDLLSKRRYDQLRLEGSFEGPSGSRIVQIFGSWSTACEIAGVRYGHLPHIEYFKQWSAEDMCQILSQFLVESTTSSIAKYEEWKSGKHQLPSASTIIKEFGSWRESKHSALLGLRSTWRT